jgi:hypothetical protein
MKTNTPIKISKNTMENAKDIFREQGLTVHGGIERALVEYIAKYGKPNPTPKNARTVIADQTPTR